MRRVLLSRNLLTARVKELFSGGKVGGMWDLADKSTLFLDTAGTTPLDAAGQAIARANDLSGLNNHATQPTSSARPLYQVVGARGCGQFDASDDGLLFPAIAFNGPFSVFVSAKTVAATQGLFFVRTADLGSGFVDAYQSGSGSEQFGFSLGTPSCAVNGVTIAPQTRDQLYSQINGVASVVESINVAPPAYTAMQFSGYGSGYNFNGNAQRMLMISGALTNEQKLLCRKWCAEKTGVLVA